MSNLYRILVRDRESGEFQVHTEGEAQSRRKFLRQHGQSHNAKNEFGQFYRTEPNGVVGQLISEKKQWAAIKAA